MKKHLEKIILYLLVLVVALQRADVPKTGHCFGLAAILFFYWCYRERTNIREMIKQRLGSRIIKTYALFLICFIPSLLCSDTLINSLSAWWKFFVVNFFPCFMVAIVCQEEKLLEKLWLILLLVVCTDACVGLYQVFGLHLKNAYGFSGYYLHFAGFLACFMPAALVWPLDENFSKKFRLCAALVLVILLVCAFVAVRSRALWCILLLLLILTAVAYRKTFWQHKLILTTAVVGILFLGFFFLGSKQNLARLQSSTNTTTNGSNIARLYMWRSATMMLQDFPCNGVGIDNYQRYYPSAYENVALPLSGYIHPHSSYFMLGAEAGIPGFVAYLGATLLILTASFRKWLQTKNVYYFLLFVSWLSFSIFSFIEPIIFYTSHTLLLSFLGGTFLAGAYLYQPKEEQEHEA